MPNPNPSVYFPAISKNANNELVFTTADSGGTKTFPLLTNAEANPSTGDIREMAYAILYQISINHQALGSPPVYASGSSSIGNLAFPEYQREVVLRFTLAPSGTEELLPE